MSDRTKRIAWITQGATLDTDIYVWSPLGRLYDIDCFILRTDRDPIDYDLASIENEHISINIIYLPGRALDYRRVGIYWNLVKEVSTYDAVYMIISGQPFLIPFAAARLDKSKTIIGIHNVHILKGGIHPVPARIYRDMALSMFRFFDTFSESQYSLLKKKKPDKTVFMTRMILRDYGKDGYVKQDEKITFLAYGNIRTYKRFDVLIDAAQRVKEQGYNNFKVIIAGSCDDWDKYQKKIKHPDLFELHIERIKNEDIPILFGRCHFVVMPYQDIAQSGVGFVAINYKRPLIVSKLDAFEEIVDDSVNGFFIKPADVDDLTRVIERCLSIKRENYDKLVTAMGYVRNKYTEERVVDDYIKMFRSVLD